MAPCARCGTFLCGDCTEVMGEEAYCADCIAWLHKHGPVSRAVQVFIGLEIAGIVGIPLCLVLFPIFHLILGAAGLWVSARELRRIRRGEGPLRGTLQAKVARALAVVSLVLAAVGAVGLLWLWLRIPRS